jgi:predicted nucleic acid-binding protein
MNSVVVDTDVVSFLFKRDSRAELYKPHLTGKTLVISFMTVAELDRWPLERNWSPATRAAMELQLRKYVVHPYDRELCRKWAEVTHEANKKGRPIQCADAWVAATASLHGIPLVTHNRKDYGGVTTLSIISEG